MPDVSETPWSEIDKAQLPAACYAYAGDPDKKATWALPYREGAGDLDDESGMYARAGAINRAGVHAAAGRFNQVKWAAVKSESDSADDAKRKAAKKLVAAYRAMEEEPPEALREAAGLSEAVKGSHEALREELHTALWSAPGLFGDAQDPNELGIEGTFDGHVIVHNWRANTFYRADWSRDADGKITFAGVVEVEPAFQPVSGDDDANEMEERAPAAPRRLFTETVQTVFAVEESDGKSLKVKGTGITAGVVNANGRRYPRAVLQKALAEWQDALTESRAQGRLVLTGEVEHPSDKPTGRPSLLETVAVWRKAGMDDQGRVKLEGEIIPTAAGRDLIEIIHAGVPVGISQRAYGESKIVKENGREVEEVTALTITGYDFVMEPSDPNGGIEEILESKRGNRMEVKELVESPEFQAAMVQMSEGILQKIQAAQQADTEAERGRLLREALGVGKDAGMEAMLEAARKLAAQDGGTAQLREALGLPEDADLIAEARRILEEKNRLEAEQRKREVGAFVEQAVGELKDYPDEFKAAFKEAVEAAGPKDLDEAKSLIAAKRKEYDPLVAAALLRKRGYDGPAPGANGDVQVLGSVLERETGTPEFARAAHELTESLVRHGLGRHYDYMARPVTQLSPAERLARSLVEKFDAKHRRTLTEESRRFAEAEISTDLAMPQTVTRTIIAQVFPQAVALNIFDVAATNDASPRILYETYADETGVVNTVSDEDVTFTALDTWYSLANARVQFGTVNVEPNGGGTPLVEFTDYLVDYEKGKIMALSTGDISGGATCDVDYTYDALRKGELAAIERGKQTLAEKTLETAADRLGVLVTSEATKFSRSQLQYDAVARAIDGIIRRFRLKKDKDILYAALAAVLTVANNSGGAWPVTRPLDQTHQEHLAELERYIGVAKNKVANDHHYEPTAIVASLAVAELLSNSDRWQRPDNTLNPSGNMGGIKGLPLWGVPTAQFTDDFLLVVNRELVIHRIYDVMALEGPYAAYADAGDGTNKLLAAKQYYIEEYNGTDAPVAEKGSYVKITA